MKRNLLLILFLILAIALTACGGNANPPANSGNTGTNAGSAPGNAETPDEGPSAEAEITIRAGVTANPEESLYKGLLEFKELVEAKTNGEIAVDTYYIGQLGDDRTMIENLQLGSQEVVMTVPSPLSNFVPEYKIFDFPMLFPNNEVADAVLDGEMGDRMLEMLRNQKIVGLSYFDLGFVNVFNDQHPIESVEDFQNLKIRTTQSDFQIDLFNALGANPTPMALTEVFTALQQGTVDGFAGTLASFYASNYHEVQDYITTTRHLYAPVVFMVAEDFYDGLSSDHQDAVREAAQEAAVFQRELNRQEQVEAVEQIEAQGVTISELSPDERDRMFDALQPVIDKYADEVGQDLVDAMYNAVAEQEATLQ